MLRGVQEASDKGHCYLRAVERKEYAPNYQDEGKSGSNKSDDHMESKKTEESIRSAKIIHRIPETKESLSAFFAETR